MAFNVARNRFMEQIVRLAEEGEDVVLVTADLAAPALDSFREKFPERYVSVGIAEQNLISVASGIALDGKKTIAYAANPFTITRAYDQIRNLVSVMEIPLCIVGVGAGFHIPEYGATHCVTDDLAMVQMCPGVEIYNVSDVSLAEWLGREFVKLKKPTYIRFDRMTEQNVSLKPEKVESGFRVLNYGDGEVAVIATGNLGTEYFVNYQEDVKQRKITYIDVYKFPYDKEGLLEEVKSCKRIITLDESNLVNGFGQQMIELINQKGIRDVEIVQKAIEYNGAFPNYFGSRDYMLEVYGLQWKDILSCC